MNNDRFLLIQSVADLHRLINFESPRHPLITLIDYSKVKITNASSSNKIVNELYLISLKEIAPKEVQYGRNKFDFQEGCMIFMRPNQVFSISQADLQSELSGMGLYFHPDLILGTTLSKSIYNYTFFNYEINEALHLSEIEKTTVKNIFTNIETEFKRNIDKHSKALFVSNLELLLNYCNRFYDRQHVTREIPNNDVVSKFQELLKEFFGKNLQTEYGLVQVGFFADKLNLSANYLSDLLRRNTGKSVKEHINMYLIELAKTELLSTKKTISEIAFNLGFEYPQYFSKLFKQKEGVSPSEYRNVN